MSRNILWNVLDQKGFYQLQRELKEDEQSRKLVSEIGRKLAEVLSLTDGQDAALNRLKQSIDNAGRWGLDLQRNNLFKAADSLGIRLPSGMFASTKSAAVKMTKRDIRVKNGDVIPKGTPVEVVFQGHRHPKGATVALLRVRFTGQSGRDYQQEPMSTAIANLPNSVTGISKAPSIRLLEKWSNDGIAMTPTGKRVEPDGYGPDESPSWMLVLGMI